jgi:hypothetical protein
MARDTFPGHQDGSRSGHHKDPGGEITVEMPITGKGRSPNDRYGALFIDALQTGITVQIESSLLLLSRAASGFLGCSFGGMASRGGGS